MQQGQSQHFIRRFLLSVALMGILILAFILFACGEVKLSQNTHSNQNEDANLSPIDTLSEYTIVRGDSSGNPVLKQALNLRTTIRTKSNIDLPLSTDYIPDSGKPEILIGYTNRKASIDISMELTESTKFIIRSVENKIVVLANTQKWLEEAVNYLCTQYIQSDPEETNVSLINHTEFSEETLLMNKNHQLQFVLPNNISDHFTECAKAMIDSLNVDEFTLVTQSEYTSDHAIYIGTVTSDPISVSYADIINKNEYTARLAANNIYLQGENEILTLMSLGEFLTKLNKHLDYDFEGNLCISLPDTVNFSKTWNYSIPKPIKGNLENCESISADTHVYHFNSVSKDAFALYKHQLHAIGFHADPIVSNYYQTENMTAVLSYSPTESIMSVTIAPKGDPRAS